MSALSMCSDQGGRPACMLIFAVAEDAAALREAIAAEAGPATSVNCAAAQPRREDRGDPEQAAAASGVAQGLFNNDAWMFSSVAASDGPLSAMPDSPRLLSSARYQAAAGEVQEWQHLLGRLQASHWRAGASCTGGHAAPDGKPAESTARVRPSAADTGTVDDLLFGKRHVANASSAEGNERLSLLWACVPHPNGHLELAEFEVACPTVFAAGGGVTVGASHASEHRLLCIDVSGMYMASSRRSPAARRTHGAEPQPVERAATKTVKKTERASGRPGAARTLCSSIQTEQLASFEAHHCTDNAMAGERGERVSQSLRCVLDQRFAAATRTCPFSTKASATTCPLALTEVWVVPLLTEEGGCDKPLHSATLGVSAFPLLLHNTHRRASADFVALHRVGMQCFRLARYPPSHLLRFGGGEGADAAEQASPTMPQVAALRPRKRPRDTTAGRQDEAGESRWLGASNISPMEDGIFLHSCCFNCSGADPASPELPVVRLRVLEPAFLLLSCYFSEWCCAADFEITSGFVSPHLGKRSRSAGSYSAFFSVLRRCVLAEDALVLHSVVEEAAKWAASCGSLHGADATSTSEAATPQHSFSEALFQDSGLEWSTTDGTGNHGSERVWPLEELWGLWVRLGWTPPSTWLRVRVGLRLTEDSGLSNVPLRCIWELSPRALLAFLSRAGTAVNSAYIRAKQLPPIRDPRADRETSKVENSDHSAGADLCGAIGVGLAHTYLESVPLSSAARHESSVQMQRLLEFQAALSDATESGTRPASAGSSNATAVAPCIPTIDTCAVTARNGAAVCAPELSAAARDLAADIAATAVLSPPQAVPSPAGGVAEVVTFALTWLCGVLESPALLIPALGVSGRENERGRAEDSPPNTGSHPSGRSAVDKEAAALTALLEHRSLFHPENLPRGPPEAYLAWYPLQIPPPPSLSAAEMYCEVADVAELRWSSPRVVAATAHHGALSPAPSKAPKPGAPASACSTSSCCALACAEVARLACTKTADESANVYRNACHQLSTANPLAAFLYTRCVRYLQDQGVLTLASSSEDANSEEAPADPERVDEWTAIDVSAAGQSEAQVPSSSWRPSMVRHGSPIQGGAAALSLPEAGCCLEDEGGLPFEHGAVSTRLAEAVVRVVQESKPVVRRMLALIQSYSGAISAATAEGNGGARFGSSTQKAAATESSNHPSGDTVAQDVWCCLAPDLNPSMRVHERAGTSPLCASACATETAQRLVQAFWANVAATTRLRLFDGPAALPGREEDSSSDLKEDEPAAGSASPPASCGRAAYSPAKAAAPTCAGERHRFACKRSEAEPKVTTSSPLSLLSEEPSQASAGFRWLPSTSLSHQPPSPTPFTLSCRAMRQAVRSLDGAQAMALYMQHILRGSRAASHQRKETRCGGCPSFSGATVAPWIAPSTTADAAPPPTSPLQPSHWLQHALFLLSYGLACPLDQPVGRNDVAPTRTVDASQGGDPVCPCPEEYKLDLLPPPALAAFRALRCGKLALDAWIGVALEVYVQRWRLSAQTQ
ncbi:hypothetical protein LSCM4_01409 [Leishmania orientalis]|uniref:Uncharacterized protein n=1 Tax=Leishmania orientalis TaxID=2249476 RepID=A0A836K7Q1_9TRYP|nr:hypothetical protein LSCM4_01409 [Leishmania orientalis]